MPLRDPMCFPLIVVPEFYVYLFKVSLLIFAIILFILTPLFFFYQAKKDVILFVDSLCFLFSFNIIFLRVIHVDVR